MPKILSPVPVPLLKILIKACMTNTSVDRTFSFVYTQRGALESEGLRVKPSNMLHLTFFFKY
jgi:hypothetical protein